MAPSAREGPVSGRVGVTGRIRSIALVGLVALAGALASGCATVPQSRRQHLADPTMQLVEDPLEARAANKLYVSREAAAGGDARAAGGGCGCSN